MLIKKKFNKYIYIYKYGRTKVVKAEEVRKHFVNPKTESFWLACKLSHLQFGFQIHRSSRSGRCSSEQVLLKISQCWSFFLMKLQAMPKGNFIKKRLQHRCFSVKFAKYLRTSFLQTTSSGCFWKYLINSLFIAYENDESCHCVVRTGSPVLISFYCVCFVSFYFFYFLYFLWILLLAQVLR